MVIRPNTTLLLMIHKHVIVYSSREQHAGGRDGLLLRGNLNANPIVVPSGFAENQAEHIGPFSPIKDLSFLNTSRSKRGQRCGTWSFLLCVCLS